MRLWSIDSGDVLWHIRDSLFDAFSRDGRRVYGVASKVAPHIARPRLVCWDLRTGTPLFTMPDFAPNGFLTNIAEESANGKYFLYSDQSGATVFDLKSRKKLLQIPSTRPIGTPPAELVGDGSRFFYDSPPGEVGTVALYSVPEKKIVDRANFPDHRRPLAIGWLPRSEGFFAFCNGRWMSYHRGGGLVSLGGSAKAPFNIIVSPDERSFAVSYSRSEADGTTTKLVEGYGSNGFVKRWERPGWGVKCLPTGQVAIVNGDSVSLIDMATGTSRRTIRLEGFFD